MTKGVTMDSWEGLDQNQCRGNDRKVALEKICREALDCGKISGITTEDLVRFLVSQMSPSPANENKIAF